MACDLVRGVDVATRLVGAWRADGLSVGLVPTMGALHEGHLSLVRASVAECDRTVVTDFVNPTQFGPGEDLEAYPRRLEADRAMAGKAGADAVFAPVPGDMYPAGYSTFVVQEGLTDRLCGAHRPGHFRGVLTIVCKLFHIAPADRAYFGRKDFQQTVVLRRMVEDLNMPIEVCVLPTVREADGLAMSSRNERLTPDHRAQAAALHEALLAACRAFAAGATSREALESLMRETIVRWPDARVQYCEVVSPVDLQPADPAAADSVAALAVYFGDVRLIDNMPLGGCDDVYVSNQPG